MIIGFDGKRATQNGTGLGNYSRYIISILAKYYPLNTYRIYTPKKQKNFLVNRISIGDNCKLVEPRKGLLNQLSSLWRSCFVSKELQADKVALFVGLSNELPLGLKKRGISSIVVIHDLIFIRYPEFYKAIDCWIYKRKFKSACLNSDKIIAVSECTKRDIVTYFGVSEHKVAVVYQACDPMFSQVLPASTLRSIVQKYALPSKYILFVGSIEARKNLLLIAQALLLIPSDTHLVAVGRRTPYADKVADFCLHNGLSDRFMFFHDVLFADLPAIYQKAEIFVYPSFFEGFGIPIIEALSSGIPVIAATGSCLEEAGGEACIYVDPKDPKVLAEKIMLLKNNPALVAEMCVRGKEYIKKFADESIASQTMDLYCEVANS